jgi:hypothetical protein
MKIAFGKEYATTVLRDERVRVGQFATRIVQLVTCAAREPDRRDATVIECGSEFIKSGDDISSGRN